MPSRKRAALALFITLRLFNLSVRDILGVVVLFQPRFLHSINSIFVFLDPLPHSDRLKRVI